MASLSLGLTWVGSAIFFDFLLKQKTGDSILSFALRSQDNALKITAVSIITGFLLDFFGMYLTRLWYFPFAPYKLFFLLTPLLYLFYILVLFIMYEYFKNLLNKFVKRGRTKLVVNRMYPFIMNILLFIGLIGVFACIVFGINNIGYFNFPFYFVNINSHIDIPIWYVLFVMPCLYFIFEYFVYIEGKETFVYSIMRNDYVPLFAILISTTIGIILMEMLNAPFQLWIYANWPLDNLRILTVPLLVWFVWPTQFMMFLAAFRLILPKDKIDIW